MSMHLSLHQSINNFAMHSSFTSDRYTRVLEVVQGIVCISGEG